MPTLAREAHSGRRPSVADALLDAAERPAPGDHQHGLLSRVDDTIHIAETGRYELTINSARCIADVKRDASLEAR